MEEASCRHSRLCWLLGNPPAFAIVQLLAEIGKESSIALRSPRRGSSTWSKISSKTAISRTGLNKFFDDLTVQMRDALKETGAKVVR